MLDSRRKLFIAGGVAVAAILLLLLSLNLWSTSWLQSLFSRRGADLSAVLKTNQTTIYRTQIHAVTPLWGVKDKTTLVANMDLKIRCRNQGAEVAGWIPVESKILEGSCEVDQKPRALQLAGKKLSYRYSALRRIARWQGLPFPSGVELLEIGPPKGRVKKGERWKIEVKRILLQQQEEIGFDKFFTYVGEDTLKGKLCHRLSVSVPTTNKKLSTGAFLKFAGSGEVWISKDDGTIFKSTEILEGQLRDEKLSKEAGRFAQAMTLYEATVAPPAPPALLATSASASSTAARGSVADVAAATPPPPPKAAVQAPAPPPKALAKPAASAPVAKPKKIERLVFVSNATGKREIWSAATDGSVKECLTGYGYAHWAPALNSEGRVMLCVSKRPRGVNLWTFDLTTAEGSPLTEFAEQDNIQAGWSDGGRRFVLLKNGILWSVHRDGFNLQTFQLDGRVVDFAVTPLNAQAAVVINELNQNKILLVNVKSGVMRELFKGDLPSWSPDAKKLAYRNHEALNVANADGSLSRQVLKASIAHAPILWSPSSKKLACTVLEGGLANVQLVPDTVSAMATKVTTRGGEAHAFSKTGNRIAYLLHGDLWIASIDGQVHTRVTRDGATEPPIWWGQHYVP